MVKNKKILIIISFILVLLVFLIFQKKDKIKKYYYENKWKYFDWSEFDGKKVDWFDSPTYVKEGKEYYKDSGIMFFDSKTIDMLDDARDIIEKTWNKHNPTKKIKFVITDALRFGEDRAGNHAFDKCACAVDIRTKNYDEEQQGVIVDALKKVGFKRIGWYKNSHAQPHIHVDRNTNKPPYFDILF